MRPDMTWDEHHALCESGNLTALVAHLGEEDDPIEREVFYGATINMTHQKHPQVALAIGTQYIEEFYKTPEPFGPGHPPDGAILKRLALLFDPAGYEEDEGYTGDLERAIWVCQFALAFGVTNDGTKGGFPGRLQNLLAANTTPLNEPTGSAAPDDEQDLRMPNTIPPRSTSRCYSRATDVQRLVQIFQNSGRLAVESKNLETAHANFDLAVEAYYQIVSLCSATELERSVTQAMQTLAGDFPTKVCINEAVGICEKADKLKSIKTKLKYLRNAQEILERGRARQDNGYPSITSVYDQVVAYIKQGEAILEKQSKNADQQRPTQNVEGVHSAPPPSEFRFSCPNCTRHIRVPISLAGTAAACPGCGHELTIPQPTAGTL